MKIGISLIFALASLSFFGCATSTSKTQELKLGMGKDSVVKALGQPETVRGAIRNKFDQTVEVWQFQLNIPNKETVGGVIGKTAGTLITLGIGASSFSGTPVNYWLYFVDGTLVQWGQAGDWETEKRSIYEVRFNPSPRL